MSIIYLSKEGHNNLKTELQILKSEDRPRIINQIAEARDKGDLSENAEYDAAKEAQGLLEARISKLENDVANARVLDHQDMDISTCFVICISKQTFSACLIFPKVSKQFPRE